MKHLFYSDNSLLFPPNFPLSRWSRPYLFQFVVTLLKYSISSQLVWKNHSRIVGNVYPHLLSFHGAHNNDMVYQEFTDNLWQVTSPNFQQLHPAHCYTLHQRRSYHVDEKYCPPQHFLIHHCRHFHLDFNFIHPHLLLLFCQVYVYLQWETHHEICIVGIADFVSFANQKQNLMLMIAVRKFYTPQLFIYW